MKFKEDAAVHTDTGVAVGHVDRVVIDPRTNEVTYLIVRKGVLFTEDKVVPVGLIASAKEDGIILTNNAGKLDDLPDFEESYFVSVNNAEPVERAESVRSAPSLYQYPPVSGLFSNMPVDYNSGFIAQTTTNIPENDVAVKNGARIISQDGQHVGNVAEIMTDAKSDRVTHVVISQGLLFKSHKLIPIDWVREVDEDAVYVAVTAQTLKALPDYQTNPA